MPAHLMENIAAIVERLWIVGLDRDSSVVPPNRFRAAVQGLERVAPIAKCVCRIRLDRKRLVVTLYCLVIAAQPLQNVAKIRPRIGRARLALKSERNQVECGLCVSLLGAQNPQKMKRVEMIGLRA